MAGGDFFGDLLGAGLGLIGGQMNQANQNNINQQNIQWQQDFAQNGISWKVADARRAGINPLAALGASTSSFSNLVGDDSAGNAVSKAGQDISRAVKSALSPDDQAMVDAANAVKLKNGQLQNDLLETQIAASKMRLMNQPGNGAPTPSPGQVYGGGIPANGFQVPGTASNTGGSGITIRPSHIEATTPGDPSVGAGVGSDIDYNWSGDSLVPVPGQANPQASFNTFYNMAWAWRHMMDPWFDLQVPEKVQKTFDARFGPMRDDQYWNFDPVYGYSRLHKPWR